MLSNTTMLNKLWSSSLILAGAWCQSSALNSLPVGLFLSAVEIWVIGFLRTGGRPFLLVMYFRVGMLMLLEPCFFPIMGTYCFASGKVVSRGDL
jgi:hypothetical protein